MKRVAVVDNESASKPGERIKVIRRFATIREAEQYIADLPDRQKGRARRLWYRRPGRNGEPMTAHLQLVRSRPTQKTTPTRQKNADLRTREYLTPDEVEKLLDAARDNCYSQRDKTLILLAYRHGLRAAEACSLEWSQITFDRDSVLHVRRVKNGTPSVHPLRGDEVRELRKLQREAQGSFIFETERGGPFTPDAMSKLVKRLGVKAGLTFPIHFHMLRHACGYKLANDGHDTRAIQSWLGHRSIQHTVLYTSLTPDRFKEFWR